MAVRSLTVRVLGPAVVCIIVSMVTLALGISGKGLLIASAQAQSKQQSPLEKARTAVETLINRLRGRDMPEGIVKSNGRIEATQGRCRGEICRPAGDGDGGRGRRGHGWTGRCHHLVAR